MNTFTKTLFAAVLTGVVLTSSAFTTLPSDVVRMETISVVSNNGYNKIWVAGNVKVILVQNEKEGVFAGEDFNADKTSVIGKGQTLYINSTESSRVTIRISVKDLQRIEAAGNALVVTEDKFNVKYLQVFLSQSAKADVKATAGDVYTVISENAKLKMSGSADRHTLVASNMKNVSLDNFACLKLNPDSLKEAVKLAGL